MHLNPAFYFTIDALLTFGALLGLYGAHMVRRFPGLDRRGKSANRARLKLITFHLTICSLASVAAFILLPLLIGQKLTVTSGVGLLAALGFTGMALWIAPYGKRVSTSDSDHTR